jgi:hypothetical protein
MQFVEEVIWVTKLLVFKISTESLGLASLKYLRWESDKHFAQTYLEGEL